jgi:transcription antitermination protein NusB
VGDEKRTLKRTLAHSRSIARRCAMQALYQWQLTQQSSAEIAAQFADREEMKGGDVEYFNELLRECSQRRDALDAALSEFLDRPPHQLDPVEHAILLVGMFELSDRVDVPYKVVINEGVELAKRFGATDGQRYVNAVLDKAARVKRAAEQTPQS